ncbi:MAG: carboxypeptidase-like regulatory domain-containing protein [Armatimonadota bacterium]|nr:carboxypeptidase-like regulatory domain-containing protein [Armatimonadota bacterium]MDR7448015.1 carboxypeptidase-like regulatory domain-containing protein [Armatimonadota bacterium]MDR7459730.1 carboxypeptidase-like regulatory domain-containing protein [Armatimonadota bacterium]MDR7478611.1 carboxypeptidase-like regulatory domain-containing protein [Armatimonadota bacterium]MDR7488411.1 carboxypeptidase-like regulatory domain-containing protein [Armatimonadota bacterium]
MSRRFSASALIAGPGGVWLGLAVAALFACPAWAAEPARITLEVAGLEDARWIMAVVTDATGAPVPEALIVFKARTTFGWLLLEERSTDAAGRARMGLPAGVRATAIRAESADIGQVHATVRVGGPSPATPRVRPDRDVLRALSPQPGVISPYPVPAQVALLAAVLGGIWATYGYVAWLLWRIRTSGRSQGVRAPASPEREPLTARLGWPPGRRAGLS